MTPLKDGWVSEDARLRQWGPFWWQAFHTYRCIGITVFRRFTLSVSWSW